ncbi:MAG: magnesium/cobalt transporter CorA, partial [Erysipelotrichaceae bacterium]
VTLYSATEIAHLTYDKFLAKPTPFKPVVTWINVDGLHDQGFVENLLKPFEIHPLIIEDILLPGQRPKIESYEKYAYIVAKMVYYVDKELVFEQLSILFDEHHVITIGEKKGDVFNAIRKHLEVTGNSLRNNASDHLVYAILDAIVDASFDVLEVLGDAIDEKEEELLEKPSIGLLSDLRQYKRDLLYLHKAIWPLREVLSRMMHQEIKEVREQTVPYLRDVNDHVYQCIDSIETYRELLSGMMDLYLSSISNRLNEIMKVLTIISTIFIPLTFLAGLYGMNFKYMPEIPWVYGYPTVLAVMLVIAIGMLLYFKRKKWF